MAVTAWGQPHSHHCPLGAAPRCICGADPTNQAPQGSDFWRHVLAQSEQRTISLWDGSFKPQEKFTLNFNHVECCKGFSWDFSLLPPPPVLET